MKPLQIIAACSENHVIGHCGRIPWHVPQDLAYAGERIKDGVVIEGRHRVEAGLQPAIIIRNPRPRALPGATLIEAVGLD